MNYFTETELDNMLESFWEFDRKMIHEKYEKIVLEKAKTKTNSSKKQQQKWKCTICGYIYIPENGDPEHGIKPNTNFEELPKDWKCPICFALQKAFEKI